MFHKAISENPAIFIWGTGITREFVFSSVNKLSPPCFMCKQDKPRSVHMAGINRRQPWSWKYLKNATMDILFLFINTEKNYLSKLAVTYFHKYHLELFDILETSFKINF